MSFYSWICMASSAVSLGTVGLLFWTPSTQGDPSYVCFSLAGPTLVLSHHALYFLGPFTWSSTPVYTFVSSSSDARATPATSTRVSRMYRGHVRKWKEALRLMPEERNPMASSTLSIVVLIFLAVLVAAFAISAGAVALLDGIDKSSLESSAALEMALSDTFPPPPESLSAGGTNLTSTTMHSSSSEDFPVPPAPILAVQAGLSLIQAFLLGSLALVGMRIRFTRSCADDISVEPTWDMEWVYEDDECVEEDNQIVSISVDITIKSTSFVEVSPGPNPTASTFTAHAASI